MSQDAADAMVAARIAEIAQRPALSDDQEVALRLAGGSLWQFLRATDESEAGLHFARFIAAIPTGVIPVGRQVSGKCGHEIECEVCGELGCPIEGCPNFDAHFRGSGWRVLGRDQGDG